MLGFEPNARFWSNRELRKVLPHLSSVRSVVNVSGWEDRDKEGGRYRDYYPEDVRYEVSYYPGDVVKGDVGYGALPIDLMQPLPEAYHGRCDLAFNHTVLEHVPNPFLAFEQIAKLSSDLVVSIVPFRQDLHFIPGQFGDYFRLTPFSMRYLHDLNGLKVIYESHTPSPAGNVYLFHVGTKKPEAHLDFPVCMPEIDSLNGVVGRQSWKDSLVHVIARGVGRALNRA